MGRWAHGSGNKRQKTRNGTEYLNLHQPTSKFTSKSQGLWAFLSLRKVIALWIFPNVFLGIPPWGVGESCIRLLCTALVDQIRTLLPRDTGVSQGGWAAPGCFPHRPRCHQHLRVGRKRRDGYHHCSWWTSLQSSKVMHGESDITAA